MTATARQRDLHAEAAAAIPLTVVTGFLGSGKTTLVNRLLRHPGMAETAVIVNELGEVGLDHLLVRRVDETVVLLNSGCLCCTVRSDMVDTLRDLFLRRVRGEVPEFRRVLVETTGLADPAPILHTLMTDPLIAARYRLDGVVTTVDALFGARQLDTHMESVKQAAVADRLVLTKTDIAGAAGVEALRARLARLNPAAQQVVAVQGEVAPEALLDAGLFNARTRIPDVARWLNDAAFDTYSNRHDMAHHHDARVNTFCLTFDAPLSWTAFVTWLEILLATRGENVLRVKGILNVAGEERPIVVHGVQHVFHPPIALPEWPDADRRSRLVFITRDLGRVAVESTFRAFASAASPAT
jgi:G3E family GTPase